MLKLSPSWIALTSLSLFILVTSFPGCHKVIQKNDGLWDSHSGSAQRRRLVSDAYQLKNYSKYHFKGAHFSYDCSGYIASALHKNGLLTQDFSRVQDIQGNGVAILFQYIEKNGLIMDKNAVPKIGDIVFFSNTYDRNKDGKFNDELTHIGIIESMDNDGQAIFLHHMAGRVQQSYLNAGFEHLHKSNKGKQLNTYLRRKNAQDSKQTVYLASELVHSYGSLIRK